jgi:hypothetical protein
MAKFLMVTSEALKFLLTPMTILTLDANEASVTTDNQGSFTKLLFGDGTLVSKGGFDLDTGADLTNLTLVHNLAGYETSKLASPFTTFNCLHEQRINYQCSLRH